MSAYITFEAQLAFASGIQNSQMLASQVPLYKAMQSKCGDSFLGGTVQAAGGLSSGLSSAGLKSASVETSMVAGIMLAFLIGMYGYML